jgi:dolichyl-phosphate-mannose--protein O-mannosyl transferase
VPWLLVLDRPIYQFYTIAFVAFIALALAYVGQVATKAEGRTKLTRITTRGLVLLFLIAAAALAWKFAPINYGIKMTPEQAIELRWLETWDREPDRGEPMGNTEIFLQ